ncbi:MAG: response regulator [Candidatus Eisenbacteria bacterium]
MNEPKRILIVEDEAPLADVLKYRLEGAGFEVSLAVDGQEGLCKAREEAPALIILDLMLPKLDGYKVCRLLKFDEKFKGIPIIILSARKQESDVKLATEMGADLFISKPYKFSELLEKISLFVGAGSTAATSAASDPARRS